MLIIEHMIFELQTNAQKGKKMKENDIYVHIY